MRPVLGLVCFASSLLFAAPGWANPEAQLQRDATRVNNPVARHLMRFVASKQVPLQGDFAPYKLQQNRHGSFPQLLLPGPRDQHLGADRDAIRQALWGQAGAENLVQFFKAPRRSGRLHHLYVALLMPDPQSGALVPTVFDNLDDSHHPVTTGLRRNPAHLSEGTSDRFGVFVEYDPAAMREIRDFFELASGPRGRELAIGSFSPGAGPGAAKQPRDRSAGCTSYLAACRLSNGKTMVEEAGGQDQLIATHLLDSLLRDSHRIAFSVLHNPQVTHRRMLLREGMLDVEGIKQDELARAAQELDDPHSTWVYTR